jgi:hypothetical protein
MAIRDLLFILLPMIVWLFVCSLVARAASAFHRPPGTWFLLALICSPPVAFVLLLVAGDPEKAAALREKEEEIRHRHPELKDVRDAALNEMACPHCGAAVNPITEDGLHSPEAEPWLLICNQCQGSIEPDV